MNKFLLFMGIIVACIIGTFNLYIVVIVDNPISLWANGFMALCCFGMALFLCIVLIRDVIKEGRNEKNIKF
jgi:hypothetical protein